MTIFGAFAHQVAAGALIGLTDSGVTLHGCDRVAVVPGPAVRAVAWRRPTDGTLRPEVFEIVRAVRETTVLPSTG